MNSSIRAKQVYDFKKTNAGFYLNRKKYEGLPRVEGRTMGLRTQRASDHRGPER